MMIIDDAQWQFLLLTANVFVIGAAAVAVARLQRELVRSRQIQQNAAVAALSGDGYDDRGLRRMIDQRFITLRGYLDGLQQPSPSPTVQPPSAPAASMSFEYAARMARAGSSVDELVRACGLNRGEAQLLKRLHSGKAATVPTTTH